MNEAASLSRDREPGIHSKSDDSLGQWLDDRKQWEATQPATALLGERMPVKAVIHDPDMTVATDGVHLYVNPLWSQKLDDTSRRFIHAHLIWHCAANHYRIPKVRDERRWHLACDHEVNTQLLLLGFDLPIRAVLFPACIGKPVSKVHDWLADSPLSSGEFSLDEPPWPRDERRERCGTDLTEVPGVEPLQHYWRERSFRAVRAYAGTSSLPAPVASWLLAQ